MPDYEYDAGASSYSDIPDDLPESLRKALADENLGDTSLVALISGVDGTAKLFKTKSFDDLTSEPIDPLPLVKAALDFQEDKLTFFILEGRGGKKWRHKLHF